MVDGKCSTFCWKTGHPSASSAATRPPQAATTVARSGSPPTFHTAAREHPTAVQRQPGHQVQRADHEVRHGQALHGEPEQAVGEDVPEAERDGTDSERGQRPDDGDHELRTRRPGLAADLGGTAEEVDADRVHGQSVVARGDRVGRLVQEDREVEQDRERQPGDVREHAQPGRLRLDPRRHQEGDQRRDHQPGRAHQDVDARDLPDPDGARGPGRRRLLAHPPKLACRRSGVGALA